MDSNRFDALARAFAACSTRRGLLGLLTTLPIIGRALTGLPTAEAKKKRKKKKHKKHKKKCKANSTATTCAGKCGQVQNNCKKTVDCGSCACDPPCNACTTCQDHGPTIPGTCIVDPNREGEACGDPGQFCQSNGACACDATSCSNPTPICDAGVCVGCADGSDCAAAGAGNLCCAGACLTGDCCDASQCDKATPLCVDHACIPCSASNLCPTGCCDAASGECLANCPTCQSCTGGTCQPDATQDGACCGAGQRCAAGTCEPVATATLAECGGGCNASDSPFVVAICAQLTPCPSCDTCSAENCTGALGAGRYCIASATGFDCASNTCPEPSQVCCGGTCKNPET